MSVGAAMPLAASATASAATGLPTSAAEQVPYPPSPNEDVSSIKQENDTANNINLRDRENNHRRDREGNGGFSDGCEGDCSDGCGEGCRADPVAKLPFTGTPVATVALLGGGLLAAGAVVTLISVRRRRSASAE
ncbi:hypothetical protein [Streptosporangium vulgare]|uniref:Gram-positive cocci surface proteins LPxTG domain-containing protein n=1 Tax=Streptosporangium vulgare TaxID=46190 RepID=A0ABV5TU85_9ACTN